MRYSMATGVYVLLTISLRLPTKHVVNAFTTTTTPSATTAATGTALDPLLSNILIREAADVSESPSLLAEESSIGGLLQASEGLHVWRTIMLTRGRLPIQQDFDTQTATTTTVWPKEPLFSSLLQVMGELQLARFVERHPETVTPVLLTVLRIAMEFASSSCRGKLQEEEEKDDDDDYDWYDEFETYRDTSLSVDDAPLDDEERAIILAQELASGLMDEWGGVAEGVFALDLLFGADHGLISSQDSDNDDAENEGLGFGLHSGVWKHSGWTLVPELQRQLADMHELRLLMKQLGRRPLVEGSDTVHKFPPREAHREGTVAAQFDPFLPSTVSGLTLSGSLSEMLPSEAMLLKGKKSLRRLFLAKKVESKLLSYERSGWVDAPSIPKPTRRRQRPPIRMPSAPGGPIVICLDTSWSMSGTRERLSKAVVLACVSAAHKQRRSCQIVAFSNRDGVMETGEITADKGGVKRLLDFLSHSFGGGTDVIGALKHAMTVLGTDVMSSADVLLVSDGEIPDPPVSESIMHDLDHLKQRTGMKIHGLLVGKKESLPLAKLCTQTHDFLVGYERMTTFANDIRDSRTYPSSSSPLSAVRCRLPPVQSKRHMIYGFRPNRQSRQVHSKLFAKYSKHTEDARSERRKRRNKMNRFDTKEEDDDDYWVNSSRDSDDLQLASDDVDRDIVESVQLSYSAKVDEAVDKLKEDVENDLGPRRWRVEELDREKNARWSCWRYAGELKTAVDLVGEGLIEREDESRLVVLGMVSEEHVLLLGMPGTAKSALGRRLSKLCGGPFFQRLLTRFTTPEEIYGPLSLVALENDEYRRCTDGFLPTASVAFLDEIFKANSAILNTLLTILNERQFDNGAGGREKCPIRCVVGASNEMPDSDELDALYDRFLLRKEVLPVSDDGLMQMLSMPTPGSSPCDTDGASSCDVVFSDGLDKVIDAVSSAATNVHMGNDICCLIRDLRAFLRDDLDVDVSDRRLVKAARLLKISASSNGRTSVDPIDCLLLEHVAWQTPEQQGAIHDWLWDRLTPGDNTPSAAVSQFRLLLNNIRREVSMAVRKTAGDVTGASGAREADLSVIQSLQSEVKRIADLLEERLCTLDRYMELLRRSMDHLWLNPDEARAAQQELLPRAEAVSLAVNQVLVDALALERAISESSGVSVDLRLSVIDSLWDDGADTGASFSEEEMNISMKEAKSKYDLDTFRAWKRARKKAMK